MCVLTCLQALLTFSLKQAFCPSSRNNGGIIRAPTGNNHSLPSVLAGSRENQDREQKLPADLLRLSKGLLPIVHHSLWFSFLPESAKYLFCLLLFPGCSSLQSILLNQFPLSCHSYTFIKRLLCAIPLCEDVPVGISLYSLSC